MVLGTCGTVAGIGAGMIRVGIVIGVDVGIWGSGRRGVVWVAFAPEAGEEEGVAGAEVVGADAGALETGDSCCYHVADATHFFRAGDGEESSLLLREGVRVGRGW